MYSDSINITHKVICFRKVISSKSENLFPSPSQDPSPFQKAGMTNEVKILFYSSYISKDICSIIKILDNDMYLKNCS